MNEPIISPWLFYICGICDSISNLFTIGLTLAGIGMALLGGISVIDGDFDKVKALKKYIVIWLVVGVINSFIPSKTVLYQMIIANNFTQQNIEKVGENVSVLVDKIIEASQKWEKKK